MRYRIYFHRDGIGYSKKITLGIAKKVFGFNVDTKLSDGFILIIFFIRIHYKNIITQGGRYPIE